MVIQHWIMRFGLYKLKKTVEKRDDWVFVLDHTIEFGTKKCLLVLGFTLEVFRKNKCRIRHRDVETLAIDIVESATAKSVRETLQSIEGSTGVPVQILSDGGSNIKRGIADFLESRKNVRQTYDVTHKAALILKKHLKDDDSWKSFVDLACKTKRSLVHTPLGYAAPPKPRNKARWLNLDAYIDWAEKVLAMDKNALKENEREKHEERLSWLPSFRRNIKEWRGMLDLVQALKNEVKSNGLRKETKTKFLKAITKIKLNTPRLETIKADIVEYIKKESAEMGVQPHPGCSDIIESVLGKYKSFSERTPMKEIGKSILTIPVFTSDVNLTEVKKAMEAISTNDVNVWLGENVGESLFVRRKRAFSHKKTKNTVKKFPENLPKAG